jgi:hypothetical protein
MTNITHLIKTFTHAVIARSGATKQSRLCAAPAGLPRYARNDVVMLARYGG